MWSKLYLAAALPFGLSLADAKDIDRINIEF